MLYLRPLVNGPDAAASGEGIASEFDAWGFEIRQPCAEEVPRLFGQVQTSDRFKLCSDFV
jgi:hypothetical protein